MQNIKNYKLNINEQKKASYKLGLNNNSNSFFIKKKHCKLLTKKIKIKLQSKLKNDDFNSFNQKLKNYKHFRNINGYPSRGQRTHTNAKTKKKNKFKNIL